MCAGSLAVAPSGRRIHYTDDYEREVPKKKKILPFSVQPRLNGHR